MLWLNALFAWVCYTVNLLIIPVNFLRYILLVTVNYILKVARLTWKCILFFIEKYYLLCRPIQSFCNGLLFQRYVLSSVKVCSTESATIAVEIAFAKVVTFWMSTINVHVSEINFLFIFGSIVSLFCQVP